MKSDVLKSKAPRKLTKALNLPSDSTRGDCLHALSMRIVKRLEIEAYLEDHPEDKAEMERLNPGIEFCGVDEAIKRLQKGKPR